ncbi:Manganese/iron superoxide dismutase [Ephemerocybe angulata]|uniref:Manganese/iron superoxide dismutase n=1 Tax=Ephemerocybe angulata TaxID=980116 RepID=A0A8H6IEB7_9AGAR|nr:Manganese/iron superoxide dismutase [Tulosesus angulatus]
MASTSSLRLLSRNLKRCSVAAPRSTFCSRSLHQRRALLYPESEGLGNFLPSEALKTAIEWQDGLLERLNEEVKDTPLESQTVVQTVLETATQRENTLAFNYASLALNNSFFLDNIKPPPAHALNHEHEISQDLAAAINKHYGSIRQLKSSYSAAALGMSNNGWVWFVSDGMGVLGVLPTLGPGTLLVQSRTYMANEQGLILGDSYAQAQGTSEPSSSPTPTDPLPGVAPSSPASGVSSPISPRPTEPGRRFAHSGSGVIFGAYKPAGLHSPQTPTIRNVGEVLYPLFCVPVFEHSWIQKYGVWGKEPWLQQLWPVVDWAKVSESYKRAKAAATTLRDGSSR